MFQYFFFINFKSENLLLDADMNIKLADFGFANYYDMVNPLQTFCGSPPYAAPEVFSGQQYYGPEIDIWSLGVILFVLVTGTLPFNSDNLQQLKQKVLMGKFTVPYFVSKECENLIRNMLLVDPRRRFTLEQVKRHPWLRLAHMSCLNNQHGALQCNYESSNSNLHKSIINSAESSKKVNSKLQKKSYSLSNLATKTRNMNYYKVIPKAIETTKEHTTQFNNKHILYDPCCIMKNLKEIAKSNRSTRFRSQSFNSISDLIFKTNNQSIDLSSNGKKASFKRNKKAMKSYDEESTVSINCFSQKLLNISSVLFKFDLKFFFSRTRIGISSRLKRAKRNCMTPINIHRLAAYYRQTTITTLTATTRRVPIQLSRNQKILNLS